MKIIIVGGGWAGCAAALSAKKFCDDVILVERTDMLLGTGLVGGIMNNNGRFTAAEEMISMGGGELFNLIEENLLHRKLDFPGHKNASIYNTAIIEAVVRKFLTDNKITIYDSSRFFDAEIRNNKIHTIKIKHNNDNLTLSADVFIDATGTAGPGSNCTKFGHGCVMCILRCPSFGGRVSLAAKAGVQEIAAVRGDSFGGMSGACKLMKESLSSKIANKLNNTGIAIIPIPEEIRRKLDISDLLSSKVCQQYALPEFKDSIILIDSGKGKMMLPYFPLNELRKIDGFENARYEDHYAGSKGNSIRYMAMSPRDNTLKVDGIDNLFCAGEKCGQCVGHTEAICTGTLAGYNATMYMNKGKIIKLSTELAVGEFIRFSGAQLKNRKVEGIKCTFSGAQFFQRMKDKGLYITDIEKIKNKVANLGLSNLFSK
ncbi:MAG TPA: FAD-dependent oxidoreductase [Victivallales bacterium]|nr:FAD-dependent oxidoreductase [Victivallales bacterium]